MKKKIIVDGIETFYTVSEEGIIENSKTGKIKKINNGNVQLTINGKNKNFSVGRAVLEAFQGKPDDGKVYYIYHVDGDKENNKLENLQWITGNQNSKNVWDARRNNNTTGIGQKVKRKKKRENIVEFLDYSLEENERQIKLDGVLWPYSVSTEGKIKNLRNGNFLKGTILHSYQYINFRWNGIQKNKAVHILVAQAFIPNPENKPFVDHIDGDRLNNKVENLRWATQKENANNIHLDKTPTPPQYSMPIFTEEEIEKEKWIEYKGHEVSSLGRIMGKNKKILNGSRGTCGYIFYGDHILGHLLVWEAFNGLKPEKMVINHINGNKWDNRLSNLELVTHQENMRKASEETNAWNFRKVGEFDDNGVLLRTFANASAAAREIGILPSSMRNSIRRNGRCFNGLSYRYLENN